MPVDINDLIKEKNDVLERLKEIKNDIKNEKFAGLRAEYMRVQNRLRYFTDEEHRRKKIDYVKKYQATNKKTYEALSGYLIAV